MLQIGGGALRGDDGAALDALVRAGAEAAPVPAENGVEDVLERSLLLLPDLRTSLERRQSRKKVENAMFAW